MKTVLKASFLAAMLLAVLGTGTTVMLILTVDYMGVLVPTIIAVVTNMAFILLIIAGLKLDNKVSTAGRLGRGVRITLAALVLFSSTANLVCYFTLKKHSEDKTKTQEENLQTKASTDEGN